jgi:hypothetical protein
MSPRPTTEPGRRISAQASAKIENALARLADAEGLDD